MKYYFFAVLYLFLVSNIFAQLGLKNGSVESKVYMQNMNIDELEKRLSQRQGLMLFEKLLPLDMPIRLSL